jgi:S1-C subfamily serine protease
MFEAMAQPQSSSIQPELAVERASSSIVRVASGCGGNTGIVIDDRGHVVTSLHALRCRDDDRVSVSQGDERREAVVVGRDTGTDIALLHIEGEPLGKAIAGVPHDDVRVGQLCLALGRPGRSVRASLRIVGVLAKDFRLARGDQLEAYIESDRHLPSGFGGGPLVDLEGRAIGMNTRAAVRGADLAIPYATIVRIAAQLEKGVTVQRGYLGVGVQPVALPTSLHAIAKHGALVVALDDGGPAEKGGLLVGDIIVSVASTTIESPRDLQHALFDRGGQRITVRVVRAGQGIDVELDAGKKDA